VGRRLSLCMSTSHSASRTGASPRRGRGARPDAQAEAKRAALRRPQDAEVRVRLRGIGSMAVGSVDAIGAHAVGFARGDRVVFPLTRDERRLLDEPDATDGNEDTLLVGAERLIGVPRDVGDEQAARLLAPGLTARVLLRQVRPVKDGDRVRVDLDPGIGRGVLAAWAAALGATVVGDDESADVVLGEGEVRQSHAIAFRRGRQQVGSADVFAAIRDGVFDDVLTADAETGSRAAA
jgi:NADPH:quinone reductase-like Zn-dependent oxidoreductase